jgi:putative RecB family exonuclease
METADVVQLFSDEYTALTDAALDRWPNTDQWMSAGPYDGGQDIERRFLLGREQTRAYVQWSQVNEPNIWTEPTGGEPGLELSFMVELGGVAVRGFIDQALDEGDNAVRVRDLKTGSTRSKFQLQTYSVAMRKQWGVNVEKADWYLAQSNRLSRTVKVAEVLEEEIGQRYADMDAGVKRGDFPANPGYDCRFCDVNYVCPFFSSHT